MMNVYQEMTLMADADISPYFLWSKVYARLHIALADVKNKHDIDGIGVSFPQYKHQQKNDKTIATLGNKLRIFANTADDLEKLALSDRLDGLIDYVHLTGIKEVGDKATGHVVVKRYRHKSLHFYVKNYATYHNISYDEAVKMCQHYDVSNPSHPYINLTSSRNGHQYKLSIEQTQTDTPLAGTFNTYGINNPSASVTVPHW